MTDILIVDDSSDNLMIMRDTLVDCGYEVRTAVDADGAIHELEREPDMLLLDLWLRDSSGGGMEVLDHVRTQYPDIPVVMISAHGSIKTAVQAMEKGAFTFIEKPPDGTQLREVTARAVEMGRLRRENAAFRARARRPAHLLGDSQVMARLRSNLVSVAEHNSRVLFTGPPGSGKEEAARFLHAMSPRAEGPFVSIGAVELSQLASGDGFAQFWVGATGGTLLLDEVADLDPSGQKRVLRILVDQTVGRNRTARADVRVVATTAQELRKRIAGGQFREDLFHRIAVVEVDLPPLRARRRDIPELAHHLMERIAAERGCRPRQFSPVALTILQAHSWPGNVRELRNEIERLLIGRNADQSKPVLPGDISHAINTVSVPKAGALWDFADSPLREARTAFERKYLQYHADLAGGNVAKMAEQVGLERTALHRKLRALSICTKGRASGSGHSGRTS